MRALYLSLCIVAVTALPPRQFKRITEKKLEPVERKLEPTERKLEPLEKKIEPATEENVESITPVKENANAKDVKAEVPVSRSYYENQSHVVSTTTSYTEDKQVNIGSPEVHIGRPQLNPNNMPIYLAQAPGQVIAQAPMQVPGQVPPFRGSDKEEDGTKNVYTVNVYVNFPAEESHETEDEDGGWFKTKDSEKNKAGDKCKDGQLRVKGICVDRHK